MGTYRAKCQKKQTSLLHVNTTTIHLPLVTAVRTDPLKPPIIVACHVGTHVVVYLAGTYTQSSVYSKWAIERHQMKQPTLLAQHKTSVSMHAWTIV